MEPLIIKRLTSFSGDLSAKETEKHLEEQCALYSLEQLNWSNFPYKPDVKFRIAHTGHCILLKFYVSEKNIAAKASAINGDVYKDSCVEFFVSPKADGVYYNFEFSCIGVPHVGYGAGRHNRELLSPDILSAITTCSSLGDQPFSEKHGDFTWELLVQIPLSCFIHDAIESLSGRNVTGNFYKCGDDLSEPHFVSWNPINTENPDYHRPEFFGKMRFE